MGSKGENKSPSFIHIFPNYGEIKVNNFSPVVMIKKIKLQRSDQSGNESLPQIAEEDLTQVEPREQDTSMILGHDLSFVHTLSRDERNAHINKCLEMSLENKITPKNAFALQLIDCLGLLAQEKQDFSKMACTLDAGAKIYSYRVDALHHQVIKLAGEMVLNQKQKEKLNKNNDEEENESMSKEKRRERKKNILVSSESLQRKLKGKDPRSRFVKIEGIAGSVTNRVRRDPKDMSYSLENNLPFWKNWDKYKPLRAGGTVPLPNIKLLREKQITQDVEHLETESIQTEESNKYVMKETMELHDDVPDLPEVEESYDYDLPSADFQDDDSLKNMDISNEDKNVNKEVGVVATAMKRLSQESGISAATCRLEALKLLFNEVSDYHYLDIKNVHFWAGPEFWKRSKVEVQEKKKISRNKKEPGEILYDCNSATVDEKWNSLFKNKINLRNKKVRSWTRNKITLPMDLKVEIKLFFELFHLANFTDSDKNVQDKSEEINSSGEVDTYINNDKGGIDNSEDEGCLQESSGSINSDPMNSSFYDRVPGQAAAPEDLDTLNSAFYDVGLIPTSSSEGCSETDQGRVIGVQLSLTSHNSFDEDTLVPAPKIITYKPIAYSVRPIQVDMRHLKETMMSLIHEEIEHDLEEKMSLAGTSATVIPETRFSNIFKKLPNKLHRTTAKDLSVAMAFQALLTVTNENNLQLEDTGNSDIIIRLEN